MGKLDLKIKKPGWKRTDVVEIGGETDPEPVEEVAETVTNWRSRGSRPVRVAGAVVLAAVSLLTLSKFRNRRRVRLQDDSE